MTITTGIRPGFRAVTPYLVVEGASELIDFMKQAFGAEELFRMPRPEGGLHHAEVKIGDSILELADCPGQKLRPAPLHLHVPNVDTVYRRAVEAGGTGKYKPVNQPYGSREAFVLDACGNHWCIATDLGKSYIPEGLNSITLGFRVANAARMIEFITKAFDGKEIMRAASDNGTIHYSQVRIDDSVVSVSDPQDEYQPMAVGIHLYVADADAVFERALAAGGHAVSKPVDQPYGERSGTVQDEFGNHWYIATSTGQQ